MVFEFFFSIVPKLLFGQTKQNSKNDQKTKKKQNVKKSDENKEAQQPKGESIAEAFQRANQAQKLVEKKKSNLAPRPTPFLVIALNLIFVFEFVFH